MRESVDFGLNLPELENKADSGGDMMLLNNMVQDYVVLNTSDVPVDESAPISATSAYYITIYILSYGLLQILSKYIMVTHLVSPFEVLAVRGSIGIILNLFYLWYCDISLFDVDGSKARKVLTTSLFNFLAIGSHYIAIQHLPLGTAFSIEYISFSFALFFDSILVFSAIKANQLIGYAASFLGIIGLIFEERNLADSMPISVLVGLGGSLFSGIAAYQTYQTIGKVNPLMSLIYSDFLAACFSPGCAFFTFWENKDLAKTLYTKETAILLGIIGILGFVSNYGLSKSTQIEKVVTRPFMFRYPLVIIGLFFDIWYSDLYLLEFIGMILIGVQFVLAVKQ